METEAAMGTSGMQPKDCLQGNFTATNTYPEEDRPQLHHLNHKNVGRQGQEDGSVGKVPAKQT